ncbi:MAG: DNA polymerase ligase N-terminal domain-containing protein [Pirellulales bacterium]
MPQRFVILRHDPSPDRPGGLHWDLMLEMGETLRSWALSDEPRGVATVEATALADHRKAYLAYEGPVSNNRGYVTRWDAGVYELISGSENEWHVLVTGEKIRGEVRIRRSATDSRLWSVTLPAEGRRE